MPIVRSDQVFARYRTDAENSSHFVWLLAGLTFYESPTDGWIYAFKRVGGVTLLPLEPLVPRSIHVPWVERAAAFRRSWDEFRAEVRPGHCAFVGVYDAFRSLLVREAGFADLRVGREPWIDLRDCLPRGNAGKGVRAARNQALKAGVVIEEWEGTTLESRPERRAALARLFGAWRLKRLVRLGGFMNAADPWAHAEVRRYFVARAASGAIEGYLIATPVAAARGYFLEDLVTSSSAARGTGELLTLEALARLGESGAAVASLGVVPGTVMEPVSAARLPAPIRWLTLRLPGALASIYDFGGLETFRKRFRPQRWESIYLAVAREDGAAPGTRDWLRVLLSLGRAFEPRLVPSLEPLRIALSRHLARHAVSSLVLLASLAVFAGVNHWGELPPAALSRYGFWAGAPAAQWIYRSFTSDFFYFGALHFCAVVPLYWLAIRWAERTHARAFVIAYFLGVAFFDDVINYLAIVRPFSYLEPEFFTRLIAHEDVGGSLGLMAFLGLQICQFRRNRELIFAGAALVVVLGHAFASEHRQAMMLNLDHFVFLILGYVSGKLKFEYDRRRSRAAARGKSPVARPARS